LGRSQALTLYGFDQALEGGRIGRRAAAGSASGVVAALAFMRLREIGLAAG